MLANVFLLRLTHFCSSVPKAGRDHQPSRTSGCQPLPTVAASPKYRSQKPPWVRFLIKMLAVAGICCKSDSFLLLFCFLLPVGECHAPVFGLGVMGMSLAKKIFFLTCTRLLAPSFQMVMSPSRNGNMHPFRDLLFSRGWRMFSVKGMTFLYTISINPLVVHLLPYVTQKGQGMGLASKPIRSQPNLVFCLRPDQEKFTAPKGFGRGI